ncbi:hypothetical protein BT67DRAFT_432622 [Trichocladium antarcticum]|uniref:Uncharacterized protein n=1 Tax=Trichocladium antarcticum TaxID=1450529 RepID=A0AAN6ZGP8_9PEZI|nr:hypothetical protein BT67DRAFT_432622 [Trichocladium antarcticum]
MSAAAAAPSNPLERHFDGRVYLVGSPPSEQPVVLAVTRKFRGDPPIAAVIIVEDEIHGFATVYPRLYIVPTKTRGRLAEWKTANKDLVARWAGQQFWNSKTQDRALGLEFTKGSIRAIPEGASTAGAEDDAEDDVEAGTEDDAVSKPQAADGAISPTPMREIDINDQAGGFDDDEGPEARAADGRAAANRPRIDERHGLASHLRALVSESKVLVSEYKAFVKKMDDFGKRAEALLKDAEVAESDTRKRGHQTFDHSTDEDDEEARWEARRRRMSRVVDPDDEDEFPEQHHLQKLSRKLLPGHSHRFQSPAGRTSSNPNKARPNSANPPPPRPASRRRVLPPGSDDEP